MGCLLYFFKSDEWRSGLEKKQLESTLSTLEVLAKRLLGVHVQRPSPHKTPVKMCITYAALESVVLPSGKSDAAVALLFLDVLG